MDGDDADRRVGPICEALAASGGCGRRHRVHCAARWARRRLPPRAHAARGRKRAHAEELAEPDEAVRTFAGTFCAAEVKSSAGAAPAAFAAIGGRLTEIDARYKTVYHAASVLVSKYLTALIATGLRAFEKSGGPRESAMMMIEPIVLDTVQNVFRLGLPVRHGRSRAAMRRCRAASGCAFRWDPVQRDYSSLGMAALDLAREQAKRRGALARIGRCWRGVGSVVAVGSARHALLFERAVSVDLERDVAVHDDRGDEQEACQERALPAVEHCLVGCDLEREEPEAQKRQHGEAAINQADRDEEQVAAVENVPVQQRVRQKDGERAREHPAAEQI